MLKFDVGAKVVIKKELGGHGFQIGEVVTITDKYNEGKGSEHYRAENEDGEYWWINDDEIKEVK